MKIKKIKIPRRKRAMYLPAIMMVSILFIAFATAVIALASANIKTASLHNKKITAMSIAEAGADYYLWHLSHDNTDYCDGNTCSAKSADGSYGPFMHNYTDQSGMAVGTYSLTITPPTSGSSETIVKSVGKVNGTSPIRTVICTIGMPSYAKYTLLTNNSEVWVGSGEKVEGSIFVNHSGLKNDGTITGDASSTESTYYSKYFNQTLTGINGNGIFGGTKSFPVTAVDFNQLNVDILNIRNDAKNNGKGDYYANAGSGYVGYHLILGQNNYTVKKVKNYNHNGLNITSENSSSVHDYPTNSGVIYFEDNVWVEGTINNQKLTVFAADPSAATGQGKKIYVTNPIKYTNYDGSDKLGLVTQSDILLASNVPNDMEIDAAMIAKEGQIRIDDFGQIKNNIKVYGSMAHNGGILWSYANTSGQVVSGFKTTQTVIDKNNVLNPPPEFPLTGSYAILSWREE